MTELLACIIGWAIGTFLVGVIIVAFIAAIYSNIKEPHEVKPNPELEAYNKRHQKLVDKFYRELGGPETPSEEEEIEDSPKIVENEALDELKSLLNGIVPPDTPFSEAAIQRYLWELKRTADANVDLLRNH